MYNGKLLLIKGNRVHDRFGGSTSSINSYTKALIDHWPWSSVELFYIELRGHLERWQNNRKSR